VTLAQDIRTLRDADAALAAASPVPFPLPVAGLEAVIAGSLAALSRADWWVPGLRERVGAVLRDLPVDRVADGFRGARPYKVAPPTAAPALRALHAVGLAQATGKPALVHLGIGSVSDGAFAEALNLAALTGAPVVFVVAVYPLDDQAPVGPQSMASPSALAKAHGIATTTVDGSRAHKVRAAVDKALKKGQPHLIEASLHPGADLVALADG
jgi:pyruvate dehydrogenase E1 component alpha subunit